MIAKSDADKAETREGEAGSQTAFANKDANFHGSVGW